MCHVPVLDRSLSQSFAEEKKLLSDKYNIKTEPTTLQEESHFSEDEELYTSSSSIICL